MKTRPKRVVPAQPHHHHHHYRSGNNNSNGVINNRKKIRNLIFVSLGIGFLIYISGVLIVIYKIKKDNQDTAAKSKINDSLIHAPLVRAPTIGSNPNIKAAHKKPIQDLAVQHDLRKNSNDDIKVNKVSNENVISIGYAVTVTGCGSDPITEGAAVLKHAIHLTSIHGNLGGKYDYKMYALYHPDAEPCATPLQDLGYELVPRETPVAVQDIKGDFLRSKIADNGCCGEKELIKLEAYTLTQHPAVVHLDLDVVVLKPMDALFDWMLHDEQLHGPFDTSKVPIMWPEKPLPKKVNAFFTRDYNMAKPNRPYKPVQGGFLVLRPDMQTYQNYVEIVRQGDFQQGKGWGGVIGVFYGSMTFQGILPYYYDVLHPGEAVELNRCIYNQMADNPRDQRTVDDIPQGTCRTNQTECEDCRNRPVEDVVSAHFTLCQKPWHCLPQDSDIIQQRLCRKLHHEWHRIRSDLEVSWGRDAYGKGDFDRDHFYGHCRRLGKRGYQSIETPFGAST